MQPFIRSACTALALSPQRYVSNCDRNHGMLCDHIFLFIGERYRILANKSINFDAGATSISSATDEVEHSEHTENECDNPDRSRAARSHDGYNGEWNADGVEAKGDILFLFEFKQFYRYFWAAQSYFEI